MSSDLLESTQGAEGSGEDAPDTEAALEERLSRPTPEAVAAIRALRGDLMILGASGKMGPSLARMARRAMDAAERSGRVIAVARFSDTRAERALSDAGVETLRADLLDPDAVRRLPDAENIIFMAGLKFGTRDRPEMAWAMNTVAPAYAAERFAGARQVIFSTGCVYPWVPFDGGGSREEDQLEPVGDYANSCVGRERVFTWFARKHNTPLAIYRLNYAVDLRYGALVDVAARVWNGEPVDVTMGYVNVIWQGDANDRALRCFEHASAEPFVVNVTGPEVISIRASATRFGEWFNRPAAIVGREAPTALLSNVSRASALFGPPSVPADRLERWVASWMLRGGRTLGKPTHFERFDGKF